MKFWQSINSQLLTGVTFFSGGTEADCRQSHLQVPEKQNIPRSPGLWDAALPLQRGFQGRVAIIQNERISIELSGRGRDSLSYSELSKDSDFKRSSV